MLSASRGLKINFSTYYAGHVLLGCYFVALALRSIVVLCDGGPTYAAHADLCGCPIWDFLCVPA
eukprot:2223455-Prymnesium_polylepis.1